MLGASVGLALGAVVGALLGASVGLALGAVVGALLGASVGLALGAVVGLTLGAVVGLNVALVVEATALLVNPLTQVTPRATKVKIALWNIILLTGGLLK